ncbi:MAG: hypothetical protein HDT33_00570 [Clostridiales bacterium]|nr:hypothetical protein [Clostridiales bacterium]
MQQTETYKFNLIEASDKFLPAPLNENMEKVEAQLDAARAEAAAGDAALDARVSVLETHKMVTGYHAGSGFVDLGFTPIAVFVTSDNGVGFACPTRGMAMGLSIQEGGFNHSGGYQNCHYVAFV